MSATNPNPTPKTNTPGRSPRGPPETHLRAIAHKNKARGGRIPPATTDRTDEDPTMQLELYQALVEIKVSRETASKLVQAIDQHVEARVKAATEPLMTKLASSEQLLLQTQQGHYNTLAAKIDGISAVKTEGEKQSEQRRQLVRWVVGTVITTVPVTLAVLKAVGILP